MKKITRKLFSAIIYNIKDLGIVKRLASNSIGIQSTRIEINGACNAKCTFCHSGRITYNKSKHMSPELFEQILTHLRAAKLLTRHIWLYDRGEPFLHPQIGTILDICRRYNVEARISSTATKVPKLTTRQWQTISIFKLSMSGIKQSSYGRIHGLNVKTIIKNADKISKLLSPLCYAQLSWHRYKFNLDEEQQAKTLAKQLGFVFDAIDAEVIEKEKLVAIAENNVTPEVMNEIQSLILVDRSKLLTRLINQHKPSRSPLIDKDFVCPQFNQISTNYDGELLRCCGLSPDNDENRLGPVLELNHQSIKRQNFSSSKICRACISYGIASNDNSGYRIWNKT